MCVACYHPYNGKPVGICGHLMCEDCDNSWFIVEKKTTCPICREKVRNNDDDGSDYEYFEENLEGVNREIIRFLRSLTVDQLEEVRMEIQRRLLIDLEQEPPHQPIVQPVVQQSRSTLPLGFFYPELCNPETCDCRNYS